MRRHHALVTLLLLGSAAAQLPPRASLVERFDKDENGRLDAVERAAARRSIREEREQTRAGQNVLRWGMLAPVTEEQARVSPEKVTVHADRKWFARDVLRTIFLELPGDDWHGELADFYLTDVNVPGTLRVDGEVYPGVGVRYRGSSSYLMARGSRKKSFNIAVDDTDPAARVRGNRTINLLNCNQDPSLIRDAVMARVAGKYIATPRVNYVRLVINGVSWGVYANAQQFNRDFLKDWFGTRDGVRWKIERNYNGLGALCYLGEDRSEYTRAYTLKTRRDADADAKAWARLIEFCRQLHETPHAEREAVLPKVLDVDAALWFLAFEWVFQDGDGYVKQGYDYRLFEHPDGRFVPILYDNNEILPMRNSRFGNRGRRGQFAFGANPFEQEHNGDRALIRGLLIVPAWRARYLAHVRSIATKWLDWRELGPVCEGFHELIAAEVHRDPRRLTTPQQFDASLEELRSLVTARRQEILGHPSLQGPWPRIDALEATVVAGEKPATARLRFTVKAGMEAGGAVEDVRVYYCEKGATTYAMLPAARGAGQVFVATTPDLAVGQKVRYYAEARAAQGARVVYAPHKAEAGPKRRKLTR